MDNQDNLFNKIKSAAENAETKDFPSMEKVWSRIDAKLDTKVEKKHNNNWKKLLVAASIVLVVTIGYQFFKTEKEIVSPNNEIVTKETEKQIIQDSLENQNAIVSTEIENPNIKENADEILKEQVAKPNTVVIADKAEEKVNAKSYDDIMEVPSVVKNNQAPRSSNTTWYGNNNFESRGVTYEEVKAEKNDDNLKKSEDTKKLDPIVVVDGEISREKLSNMNDEDIEFILELPDPLYIINKIYYTEQELFGPNPTSPYVPLNKQKIESISILPPEKAVSIYGEKGKKGVVIVTTKDGKPMPKKE
ncbi:hypothetical protein [Flavobacterium sp.]|uniref:hypothetical protein n=1 Tax=Flavobacterium sp. TaxID=239 RepID=UPI002611814A|nr:hypothetical protein [Flavobacterium sp.]